MARESDYVHDLVRESIEAPDTEVSLPDGRTFWVSGRLLDALAYVIEIPMMNGDWQVYKEWFDIGGDSLLAQELLGSGFGYIQHMNGEHYISFSKPVGLLLGAMVVRNAENTVFGIRDPRTGKQSLLKHPVSRVIYWN
jgi:hypothetical protein